MLPRRSTRISLCLNDGLNNMVQQIMQKALAACDGNVTLTAQLLGISRKTIYNRLRLEGRSGETEKGAVPRRRAGEGVA